MARIGILTCSNATQDLGCSSVVCLADLRKRAGAVSFRRKIQEGAKRGVPGNKNNHRYTSGENHSARVQGQDKKIILPGQKDDGRRYPEKGLKRRKA